MWGAVHVPILVMHGCPCMGGGCLVFSGLFSVTTHPCSCLPILPAAQLIMHTVLPSWADADSTTFFHFIIHNSSSPKSPNYPTIISPKQSPSLIHPTIPPLPALILIHTPTITHLLSIQSSSPRHHQLSISPNFISYLIKILLQTSLPLLPYPLTFFLFIFFTHPSQ